MHAGLVGGQIAPQQQRGSRQSSLPLYRQSNKCNATLYRYLRLDFKKKTRKPPPKPSNDPALLPEEVDYNKTWRPLSSDCAVEHKPYYVIDAYDQFLDPVAELAAMYLQGRHLPTYDPQYDMGCRVIITNVDKVRVPGRQFFTREWNFYFHNDPARNHARNFQWMMTYKPELAMEKTVWAAMPSNWHCKLLLKDHLFTYTTAEHPHEDKNPTDITNLVQYTQLRDQYKEKYGQETLAGNVRDAALQDFTNNPQLYK